MHNRPTSLSCFSLLWLLLWLPSITTAEAPKDSQPVQSLPELIFESSEHFDDIDSADLDGLLKRIGDSRVVLLGESTHGSAEFYQMRARITRALIERKGFSIVAIEADWPDAESINRFVHGRSQLPSYTHQPFSTFPTWMWANDVFLEFTRWLKQHNQATRATTPPVNIYGLDFYNLYFSVEVVIKYLQAVDPKAAQLARLHYACLLPWKNDPASYSTLMQSGSYRDCGYEVHMVFQHILDNRQRYSQSGMQDYFNASQNSRLVLNGERFFRDLYTANNNNWNLRDQNMFDSLQHILTYHGEQSKAVVWAHNTHIGDARATEMSSRGEINLGQRVREHFGDSAYLVGFGTHHGTVTAASEWGQQPKVMQLPAAHQDSYGHQFRQVKADRFMLPLRDPLQVDTRDRLLKKRLLRAVGTSYYPDMELDMHYSCVSLPDAYDELIWFDETHALNPFVVTR